MERRTNEEASRPAEGAVAALAELAAVHAAKAELDRRLSPETYEAIRGAGFARHFVPARWGGSEGTFSACVRDVAAVAEGDPSAAWCASIAATIGRMAGFLPEEAQRVVWGEGPDAFLVGALLPAGTAEPVAGGWLLSGRWPYMSGVHFSDHAMLCCPVPLAGGGNEVRFLLVPRAAYTVEESWFMTGMRATGSDTLVLEPTFVPVEHSVARHDVISGRSSGSSPACHAVPLRAVSGLSFAAPVLGAARGALAQWTARVARKRAAAPSTNRLLGVSEAATDAVLARTAGQLDAAQLLLERAASEADRGTLTPLAAARAHRDQTLAADIAVTAVNELFRNAGTSGASETGSLARFWRDANTGAAHAVLQFEPAARAYAELALADASPGQGG
ncbi:Flavin-dependent monooxygenase, oxygenase subunit HsaA [Streptomyces sp. RB17]|uniref:acyl-CoA dehydrogenase family protein n=1 Tax=Streptomyces sp. RB17 TaxID=2585197 RepID=UPI001296FE8E|nr:acyl-CoA dehydrogenase family protein [Streptomyces sp. RB17]MQY36696.1 Flavin-dependent monooxygenase, oxygenase subunit HsaA [Streptomyces sp. RB17]